MIFLPFLFIVSHPFEDETMRRFRIPRRTMLKGLGVAMALPMLETMGWADPGPASATGNDPKRPRRPVRLGFFYVPYGFGRTGNHRGTGDETWFWPAGPEDFSSTGALSQTLQPLRPVVGDCLLIDRMNNPRMSGPGHAIEAARFITAAHPNMEEEKRSTVNISISADQYAAQQLGIYTALPSLELAVSRCRLSGTSEANLSGAYLNTISYRSATQALPAENNPRAVFDRLFSNRRGSGGGGGPEVDVSQYMVTGGDGLDLAAGGGAASLDQSMLDLVMDSAKDLKGKVSRADQRTLDEYLDGVRSLERRVVAIERQQAAAQRAAAESRQGRKRSSDRGTFSDPIEVEIPEGSITWTQHLEVMTDLMILAFQTDLTRIVTLPFSHPYDGRNYPELGFKDQHHAVTHGDTSVESADKHKAIDALNVEMFARMVQKMKSLGDGHGTLLDNSILMFGSGMTDTSHNTYTRVPTILAGRGGGTITTGRTINANGDNLGDLLGAILARAGCSMDQPFGYGTKMMDLS